MKLAVIGSHALQYYGTINRNPSDMDLVGDYDDLISYLKSIGCKSIIPISEGKKIVGRTATRIYECDITWPGSSAEKLYNLVTSDLSSIEDGIFEYASLDVLYMLKMTHRFKKNSPHFLKTMRDIQFMRRLHATIREEHRPFYKERLKETLDYKHPKLNQNKKDFFTDDVPYLYDHDSIHESVKLFDKPAYSYFKPDESEVLTSKKMFFELPKEKQLAAVYEESCVLALERSQIPYPETPRFKSFEIALGKVCTSITSGWFREFAWENYDQICGLYHHMNSIDANYLDKFQRALVRGDTIKPYKKD